MAYKITDSCIACGTCAGECPVGAISEGDIYVIDADTCISCGTSMQIHASAAEHAQAYAHRVQSKRSEITLFQFKVLA